MAGERTEPLLAFDPRRLGAYELVGRLGEGGMGTVYLGRTDEGTLAAVKVIRADLAPGDEFRRRFRSEVARARQVPPFCTAEVLDADPDHEHPYLVVEYVDGPTLADVVEERGPLGASHLHSVAIGVATALTAIHGAGVIHRDLKPRNVLLAPGSPKVIDFGIARATEATGSNTLVGQMLGTVAYMAPERFGDAPPTPAADVFAWGGVVAYAGTGRTPFEGGTPTATAARILTSEPELDGLPPALRDLVAHALAKDPADRPTARELLDLLVAGPSRPEAASDALAGQPALREAAAEAQAVIGAGSATVTQVGYQEDAISTQPIEAGPETPPGPEPVRRRRRWYLPAAAVLIVLAVAIGVLIGIVDRPSGSEASGTTATPAEELLISDQLEKPGYWQPGAEKGDKATCSFDGALVASVAAHGLYKCAGPQDAEPADVRAEVGIRLLTKGACAAIWFRFHPQQGYLVRICSSAVYVGTHKSSAVSVYRTFPLANPLPVDGPATRVGLRAVGDTLQLTLGDNPLGAVRLTDPDISGGRIFLGVFTDQNAPATGPFEASFSDLRIWGLSS